MQWAEAAARGGYDFSINTRRRRGFVARLTSRLKMEQELPKVEPVTLLGDDVKTAKVITFDFESQLKSLLTNTDLMQFENLDVRREDPFGRAYVLAPTWPDPPEHNMIDDVNSGRWYRDTYNSHILEKNRSDDTFLVPIILYMDKTSIDNFNHFGLEPTA